MSILSGHFYFWGEIIILASINLCIYYFFDQTLITYVWFERCINSLLRLLIIQAICDNLYLTLSFIESIRTDIGWSTDFQVLMFVTTLYPLHNILLWSQSFTSLMTDLHVKTYKHSFFINSRCLNETFPWMIGSVKT